MKKLFTDRRRLVIYLEASEVAALEKQAKGVPLSTFVRSLILAKPKK